MRAITSFFVFLFCLIAMLFLAIFLFFLPFPNETSRETVGMPRVIDLAGRQIEYYSLPAETSPDEIYIGRVVLLPSAGRPVADFNELAIGLVQNGYRVVMIESPGIGQSDPYPENYNISLFDLAADVEAVIEYDNILAGDMPNNIVGHAFGNRVARAVAASYGPLVNSVILIAAGGKADIDPEIDQALQASFNPTKPYMLRERAIKTALFAPANEIAEHWKRGYYYKTAIMQEEAKNTDAALWYSGGVAPILVLQAMQDAVAPTEIAGQVLKDDYPERVQLELIPEAGHALLPEQPEIIEKHILAFLYKHHKVELQEVAASDSH